jgi:YidC/Oxa1 family membrane protein insertase
MWNEFINFLVSAISSLSNIFGYNTGIIILVATLIIKLALLPLSVKIVHGTLRRQKDLKKIQPELDTLKTKYKNQPELMSKKTLALYKENKISFFDKTSLFGSIAQMPLFIGMMSAIPKIIRSGQSFLWISDIARPDVLLTVIAAGLTFLSTIIGPNLPEQRKAFMLYLPVLLTCLFLWKLSAGIGLYWVASNAVGIGQSIILRNKAKTLEDV